MESRYFLRGIEDAIGSNVGTSFSATSLDMPHTFLSIKYRMDFYERKDRMAVLSSRISMFSAFGKNPGDLVSELVDVAFPYLEKSKSKTVGKQDEAMVKELFDELERVQAEEGAAQSVEGK